MSLCRGVHSLFPPNILFSVYNAVNDYVTDCLEELNNLLLEEVCEE